MKHLHIHVSLILLATQYIDEKTENQGGNMTCPTELRLAEHRFD